MKGKKRERSREASLDLPVKKRKRSYSGIDLPSPVEEQDDDFKLFKIHESIADRLKQKQIMSLYEQTVVEDE